MGASCRRRRLARFLSLSSRSFSFSTALSRRCLARTAVSPPRILRRTATAVTGMPTTVTLFPPRRPPHCDRRISGKPVPRRDDCAAGSKRNGRSEIKHSWCRASVRWLRRCVGCFVVSLVRRPWKVSDRIRFIRPNTNEARAKTRRNAIVSPRFVRARHDRPPLMPSPSGPRYTLHCLFSSFYHRCYCAYVRTIIAGRIITGEYCPIF